MSSGIPSTCLRKPLSNRISGSSADRNGGRKTKCSELVQCLGSSPSTRGGRSAASSGRQGRPCRSQCAAGDGTGPHGHDAARGRGAASAVGQAPSRPRKRDGGRFCRAHYNDPRPLFFSNHQCRFAVELVPLQNDPLVANFPPPFFPSLLLRWDSYPDYRPARSP